jgi:C1A family cysteine protease
MSSAYDYANNRALCTEEEYPYTATDGTCKDTVCSKKSYELRGYVNITEGNCSELEAAAQHQAVAVAVDATSMQFYSSGILNPSFMCSAKSLNHGVTLVAYNQGTSWTIKNSWGGRWGEAGYCRMKIGNTCGICQVANYPVMST